MLAGRLLGNRGWVHLSKAEEPEDIHCTATVVGLISGGMTGRKAVKR